MDLARNAVDRDRDGIEILHPVQQARQVLDVERQRPSEGDDDAVRVRTDQAGIDVLIPPTITVGGSKTDRGIAGLRRSEHAVAVDAIGAPAGTKQAAFQGWGSHVRESFVGLRGTRLVRNSSRKTD